MQSIHKAVVVFEPSGILVFLNTISSKTAASFFNKEITSSGKDVVRTPVLELRFLVASTLRIWHVGKTDKTRLKHELEASTITGQQVIHEASYS